MAGTTFQIKRTGVSGRQPNTTNGSNSAYIEVGELALNFVDGILYSSDGSALIEVGANVTNQNITGSLTANGSFGSNGSILFSNGSGIYWGDIEGGLVSVSTDDSINGTGTVGSPLSVNYGTLDIETRTANTIAAKLSHIIANFLRVDEEAFRNPKAVAFTRADSPVYITLN